MLESCQLPRGHLSYAGVYTDICGDIGVYIPTPQPCVSCLLQCSPSVCVLHKTCISVSSLLHFLLHPFVSVHHRFGANRGAVSYLVLNPQHRCPALRIHSDVHTATLSPVTWTRSVHPPAAQITDLLRDVSRGFPSKRCPAPQLLEADTALQIPAQLSGGCGTQRHSTPGCAPPRVPIVLARPPCAYRGAACRLLVPCSV